MTPRQFHLLWDQYREALLHTELCHAYTTAALINFSIYAPKEPIAESVFMPNLPQRREKAPEGPPIDGDELAEYSSKVANIAALLEQYQTTGKATPQLVAMGLVGNDG